MKYLSGFITGCSLMWSVFSTYAFYKEHQINEELKKKMAEKKEDEK